MLVFLRECDWCENLEERTFRDSWTGMNLCLTCIGRVDEWLTNSPASEGDNLPIELMTHAGDLRPWNPEDEEEDELVG